VVSSSAGPGNDNRDTARPSHESPEAAGATSPFALIAAAKADAFFVNPSTGYAVIGFTAATTTVCQQTSAQR
jgi:hypothetical protein